MKTGRPRKPFNKYEVLEDYAIIYLPKKTGEIFKCIVDKEDMKRLLELGSHWHTIYDKVLDQYYAKTNTGYHDENGKYKQRTIYMHKLLLNYKGNVRYIDHINHNTLDNRKHNLIIVSQKLNAKNRLAANKNTTTGYRNVSFVRGRYIVQLQIDGKNTILGKFKTPEEANICAIEMRKTYYKPLIDYVV
jgi:hypothetical protein